MKVIILSFLLAFLITSNSFAQEKQNSPLSFKAFFVKVSKTKDEILIKVRLRNTSRNNVIIDRNSIGYGVSFTNENGGMFSKRVEIGSGYQGDFLILKPQEIYETIRTVKLQDDLQEDFFKSDGKYTMKVTYGQFTESVFKESQVWEGTVESNKLIINLKNRRFVK